LSVLLIHFNSSLLIQFISNEGGRMFGSDGWSISSAAGQHWLQQQKANNFLPKNRIAFLL